ncbi:TEA domain-containing protein [Rhodotorula toruloides]|nr:TEA domain-containing protein [Rhodotorula toruloides]
MAEPLPTDTVDAPAPPTPASTPRPPLTPSSPPPADPKQSADLGSSPLSSCASSEEEAHDDDETTDSGDSSLRDPSYGGDGGSDSEDEEDSGEEDMLESGSEAGGLIETDLWNDETTALLREAAHKLPNLGRRHYTVQGASYGRNGLIGEFIRRRTGIARDRFQVYYRLQALIKAAKDDLTEIAKLRGATVSRDDLRGREWTTFLGPNLFPHTKPKLSQARDDDETSRDSPPPLKRKKQSKSTNSSTSSAAPSQYKKPRHHRPYSDDTTSASPSSTSCKRVQEDDEAATRHFKPRPFPLLASDSRLFPPGALFGSSIFSVASVPASYPSSSYSLFPPPSVLAPTSSTAQPEPSPTISPPTAASVAPLLTALLTAASPSRDPSSLVHALLSSGLSTTSDLVDFLSLDNSTLRLFLEEFGKRNGMGPLDLAWVRKAFEAARREVTGM